MKKIFYLFFALSASFLFTNCAEDGEPGPAGQDGIDGVDGQDGQDGQNGQDGQDGQDGQGFDELLEYGNIMVYLDGTRPDGIAFRDTSNFRFVPIEDISSENTVTVTDNISQYRAMRFLSAPDDIYQYTASRMQLTATEDQGNITFDNFNLSFRKDIVTPDYKVFDMNDTYTETNYSNLVISDYSYDQTTNNLRFSFSFETPASSNDTGHDLNVSGEVNVIVLERIN